MVRATGESNIEPIISAEAFNTTLLMWLALAAVVFLVLTRINAPYGRHISRNWGPMVGNRLAWFLMELPVLVLFPLLFFVGPASKEAMSFLVLALYAAHYVHRSLIFPFRTKTQGKKMPLLIVVFAICFNLVNAGALGYYFGFLGHDYGSQWLWSPWFLIGISLFVYGAYVNFRADTALLGLRAPGETDYKIPRGGLFDQVSCPNYFGEIVQWIGFAMLSFCLPALAFAVWSIANLVPRALAHHKWYQEAFVDYPEERKAIIPFVL